MHCPKCSYIMGPVDFKETTVDRCTNCRGLWFDRLELEQLKGARGSEDIDCGAARTGRAYDTIKDISCPRCQVPMTRVQAPDRSTVSFETCPQCQGIFLDAGEFKELKDEQSMLGFLKKLF